MRFYVIPCFFLEEEEIKNYFYKKMGLGENNLLLIVAKFQNPMNDWAFDYFEIF